MRVEGPSSDNSETAQQFRRIPSSKLFSLWTWPSLYVRRLHQEAREMFTRVRISRVRIKWVTFDAVRRATIMCTPVADQCFGAPP